MQSEHAVPALADQWIARPMRLTALIKPRAACATGKITMNEFDANLHPKTREKLEKKLAEGFVFDEVKWKVRARTSSPCCLRTSAFRRSL